MSDLYNGGIGETCSTVIQLAGGVTNDVVEEAGISV